MSILKKLYKLRRHVDRKFPTINWGGCAVFADAVVKELTAQGFEAYGRTCCDSWMDGDEVRSVEYARNNSKPNSLINGKDWKGMGLVFYHVVVEVVINGTSYFYDSTSLRARVPRFSEKTVLPGRLTPAELNAIAHDGTIDWNDCFDRNDIPAVQKITKQYLTQ